MRKLVHIMQLCFYRLNTIFTVTLRHVFSKHYYTLELKQSWLDKPNHSLKTKLDEYGEAAVWSEIRTNKLKQSSSV